MAVKTHLYDSAEPAKEGSKLLAICGAIVPDAAFVFMWDEDMVLVSFDSIVHYRRAGSCRKCYEGEIKQRYIYGIRSGEEQKQSEAEA